MTQNQAHESSALLKSDLSFVFLIVLVVIHKRFRRNFACHLDRLEDVVAVSEDLIDLLECTTAGFWEEEINSWKKLC